MNNNPYDKPDNCPINIIPRNSPVKGPLCGCEKDCGYFGDCIEFLRNGPIMRYNGSRPKGRKGKTASAIKPIFVRRLHGNALIQVRGVDELKNYGKGVMIFDKLGHTRGAGGEGA